MALYFTVLRRCIRCARPRLQRTERSITVFTSFSACRLSRGGSEAALDLLSCNIAELLGLRQVLLQRISERLEDVTHRQVADSSPRSSVIASEKRKSFASSCGQDTAQLTGQDASQHPPSSELDVPSGLPSLSCPANPDLQHSLWQISQLDTGCSKRKSNDVPRELEPPTSPSMLSVNTAPSDGGTIRLGRAGEGAVAQGTGGRSKLSLCVLEDCSTVDGTHPSRHPSCFKDLRSLLVRCEESSDHLALPSAPISCPTCGCDRLHTVAGHVGTVTPIPECNSSMETLESSALTHSYQRSQSECACAHVRKSLRHLPSNHQIPVHSSPPAPYSLASTPDVSQHQTLASIRSSLLQKSPNHNGFEKAAKGTSSARSCKSQARSKSGHGEQPTVHYGFQSPPGTLMFQQMSSKSDVNFCSKDSSQHLEKACGPARGLLSASLSQCTSSCASPKLGQATGLSDKQPSIRLATMTWREPQRSPSVSSDDIVDEDLAAFDHKSGSDPSSTHSMGFASHSEEQTSSLSSVIPHALQAQMASLGYHRPSKASINEVLHGSS